MCPPTYCGCGRCLTLCRSPWETPYCPCFLVWSSGNLLPSGSWPVFPAPWIFGPAVVTGCGTFPLSMAWRTAAVWPTFAQSPSSVSTLWLFRAVVEPVVSMGSSALERLLLLEFSLWCPSQEQYQLPSRPLYGRRPPVNFLIMSVRGKTDLYKCR